MGPKFCWMGERLSFGLYCLEFLETNRPPNVTSSDLFRSLAQTASRLFRVKFLLNWTKSILVIAPALSGGSISAMAVTVSLTNLQKPPAKPPHRVPLVHVQAYPDWNISKENRYKRKKKMLMTMLFTSGHLLLSWTQSNRPLTYLKREVPELMYSRQQTNSNPTVTPSVVRKEAWPNDESPVLIGKMSKRG